MPSSKTLSNPSIVFCIIMDVLGYASFALPGLGEFTDIIWAPLSAFIFLKTFGGKIGRMGSIFNFLEEALPFTDFIPSFTIAWFIRNNSFAKTKPAGITPALFK